MDRHTGRASTRRDTGIFLVCVTLSLLALLSPPSWSQGLAGGIRETALRPLIALQRFAEEGRTSRERLQAAIAERDSMAIVLQNAAAIVAENARLRELLDLRSQIPETFLPADVLHQPLPTDGQTLLLGVGTNRGVRAYQPVIVGAGLVGVVVEASRSSSIAHTWANPEFRVSAVTDDGSVLGIVAPTNREGSGLPGLEFRGVAYRDTVPVGTRVVTSGLGGVYPNGIVIGWVIGVAREEIGWERVYALRPAVNLGVVSHVLLLPSVEPALEDSVP
jgi:rod shape-determining protein MreC